jgi:hypothetical protein
METHQVLHLDRLFGIAQTLSCVSEMISEGAFQTRLALRQGDTAFSSAFCESYIHPFMAFLPSPSTKKLHRYQRVVTRSTEVRSHFDVLAWLQGDMQRYLPHDILIAAWGNFNNGTLHHDVISPLMGVRPRYADTASVTPLLIDLIARWTQLGKRPYARKVGESGFTMENAATARGNIN